MNRRRFLSFIPGIAALPWLASSIDWPSRRLSGESVTLAQVTDANGRPAVVRLPVANSPEELERWLRKALQRLKDRGDS